MGIGFGLLAALGFGIADFLATLCTRRLGVLRSLLFVQLFGLSALAIVALVSRTGPPAFSSAWLVALLAGVVNFAALMLLYRAFEIGALSIVSPIASGFSVVAAGLAFLSGERLPALALLGAALLVVGVVAVARGSGSDAGTTLRGVPEALGAAVALGVDFWLIVRTVPDLGWLWPALLSRAVQLMCAASLAWISMKRPIRPDHVDSPRRSLARTALPALIGAGVLDSTGLVAFNLGVERAYTTTTAALTSLYAAVSVLLAWLFLTERLARWQWIGVGVILCGVLLVSI